MYVHICTHACLNLMYYDTSRIIKAIVCTYRYVDYLFYIYTYVPLCVLMLQCTCYIHVYINDAVYSVHKNGTVCLHTM